MGLMNIDLIFDRRPLAPQSRIMKTRSAGHLSIFPVSDPSFSWNDISPVRFDPGEGNPAEECRRADGRQMLENIWKQLVRFGPSC